MPLIDCQNIIKTYGTAEEPTAVLRGLSFAVEPGEFVAIVGPSGSGKSTLMHILGALDTPTDGQYILDGKDVSKLDEDELAAVRRQKIGFVFQAFNLLPRATVLRNVELPMIYARLDPLERKKRARAALVSAGMEESRFLYASNQISGGQMQRVAVARALVNDPAIILADEPTGNLDQKTGRIVLDTFERINAEGRTVLLITHDMSVAARASRVIRISDGQIVSDERTKKVAKR